MLNHKLFGGLRVLTMFLVPFLLINLSCTKNSDSDSEVNVYISGNVIFEGKARAVYWKNNKQILLPIINNVGASEANAIFVSGNDVYVAGDIYIENKFKAAYWKNNDMVILDDGEALDIAVKGNNIHVVGHFTDSRDIYNIYNVAAYWKNGTLTKLENPLRDMYRDNYSSANCVTISGDDLYIGGSGIQDIPNGDHSFAILWKNNIANYIDDCDPPNGYFCKNYSSGIKDIVVQGNDIYMIGEITPKNENPQERTDAVYWKNNKSFNILNFPSSSYGTAIGVKDSTVYVVGSFGARVCNNNGNNYLLGLDLYNPGHMNITGIAFNKNDEYVCGYSTDGFNAGKVYSWKNNRFTELAPYGTATDIVVVKR